MSEAGPQVAAADAEEPQDRSAAVAGQRTVETVTLAVVLAFSLLMAWDNWRTGVKWESTGPQPGYFPFYLSLILAAACLFGLGMELRKRGAPDKPFVRRESFKRVLAVFLPTLVFVPATQVLGIYVSSFILVSGFMVVIGRIRAWISIVTALVFSATMFVLFEIAFDVIMPKGPLERLLGY